MMTLPNRLAAAMVGGFLGDARSTWAYGPALVSCAPLWRSILTARVCQHRTRSAESLSPKTGADWARGGSEAATFWTPVTRALPLTLDYRPMTIGALSMPRWRGYSAGVRGAYGICLQTS